jgi:hypothetical protein
MAKASQIALTTDLWTASDLTGYMVVTAHYIDLNWRLTKRIIGFRPLPPLHTGQAIADRLTQTLLDWKAINKVAFVTLDNASSNNLAMTRLQRFLDDRSHPGGTTTSAYFHVRCLAHVINLVVKEGLKVASTSIEQLRASVLYIHGSSSRIDAFDKALQTVHINVNKRHPCKDVPTRWNATYLMIESSLPCKLAFQELEVVDDKYKKCPTEAQWAELAIMKEFLEPFYKGKFLTF